MFKMISKLKAFKLTSKLKVFRKHPMMQPSSPIST